LKSNIRCNESAVVDYVKSVFNHYAKEPDSLIMFAHNTGDHWLLVVVIPKWNNVLYLDSDRSKQRDHSSLKVVINQLVCLELHLVTVQYISGKPVYILTHVHVA
jgi:amino-acid N-acetyltransferase